MNLVLYNNTQEHILSVMVIHNRVLPSDIVMLAILANINVFSDVPEMTTMG